jgi:hypothetical protein
MTITAYSGPIISFGTTPTSTAGTGLYGGDLEHNGQRGPSVFDLGQSMMDPRAAYAYQPGSGTATKTFGFFNGVGNVDYVPIASSAALGAFVTSTYSSTTVSGAFTLAAASSATGTYSTTIIAPETGQATGTLIAIDSTAAYVTFGSDDTVAMWNPGGGTGRAIVITTSSSGDGGTWSIAGRDMYGYKMTETLSISQGTTNSSGYTIIGQKAFKYISSITNATTPTSTNATIGLSNRLGFPLKVPYAGQNAVVNWNSSASNSLLMALSTANFVAAMGSSITATSTTADVRGTFLSTTATNSVIRIQMTVTPSASAVAAVTSTDVSPLFGGTQFSSV